jgi:hypothetical protein
MNRKKHIIILFVVLLPVFLNFTYLKVEGAHPGSTGAPGDLTCSRTGCHVGTVIPNDNSINSIIFPTADSTYVPGQTYLVKLKVNKPSILRFGFEIVALKDSDTTNVGI